MDNKIKLCCRCHEKPRLSKNSYCKDCELKRYHERYQRNPESFKAKKRDRENLKRWSSQWHKAQKEKYREEIKNLLGDQCNNLDCPIPRDKLDKSCLQIDHVYGGGRKEKLQFGGGYNYLRQIYLKIKDGSKEYQLLCPYCNWRKTFGRKNNENQ